MKTLIIIFMITIANLQSKSLEKVNINDSFDNKSIGYFTESDDGVYTFLKNDFYKLNIEQKSLDLVYKAESEIISVNYFNEKYYVNTSLNGTILLDTNYNILKSYSMENTNLKFKSTLKTIKGINDELFILNDGCGLLKIKDEESVYYDDDSFLGTNHVYDITSHKNKYYFALSGGANLITDENLNIVDTVDLTKIVGFEYYRCDAVYCFDKYIIWTNQYEGVVIYNTENKEYNLFTSRTHKIDNYCVLNFLNKDNQIFMCTVEGLYVYNFLTGEETSYKLTNDLVGSISPSPNTVFDIVKINDIYYVSTRNGIYYINEAKSSIEEISNSTNKLYSIVSNHFICKDNSTIEIYDLNSKLIFSEFVKKNQTIDLKNYLNINSFYIIKVSNNKISETSKFIISES